MQGLVNPKNKSNNSGNSVSELGKIPLVIAHRGGSFLVKFENTTDAFDNAVKLGVDMIEFDVRKSKDGKMIIYHDDCVLQKYKISEYVYSELNEVTKEIGFNIPLFEDIVRQYGNKVCLDIELKENGYEEEIVELVKKYLDYDRYVIKSFLDDTVKKIKEIDPKIRTGLLLGKKSPKNVISTRITEIFPRKRILDTNVDFVSPGYELLKIWNIFKPNLLEKEIYVWSVNDGQEMDKIKNKVNAIITDRPDLALKIIRK